MSTPAPPSTGSGAAQVAVSGASLTLNGGPFYPVGFNMIGLLTPGWCQNGQGKEARKHFGEDELAAARAWGANTLRFQVSQRGVADATLRDEQRARYLQRVADGVALARSAGFVVILSMQDQFRGCGNKRALPSQETIDAWRTLVPSFGGDHGVLFELFNEPQNEADGPGWQQWLEGGGGPLDNGGDPPVGHRQVLEAVRQVGAGNTVVVDGARLAGTLAGVPRLPDPNVVYAAHPYFIQKGPRNWDERFGSLTGEVPVLVTEWNFKHDECGTQKAELAPQFLQYLFELGIGVIGHAFDIVDSLIADWSWAPTDCASGSPGAGAVFRNFLAGVAGR
jgi:endoglucanase